MQKNGYTFATVYTAAFAVYSSKCVSVFLHQTIFGHKTNLNVLGQERFKEIVLENTEPLKTERYPGYKRGSKSFNDECGVPGAGTKG